MKTVEIYTDGACSGNPGKGGWCAILLYNGSEKVLSGAESLTTNNRMEITAIIEGLRALKEPCNVKLYSDSSYCLNPFMLGWLDGWKAKGWRKKDGELKNKELWQALVSEVDKHNVTFYKVKGHSDNLYNNRCDEIASGLTKKE